MNNKAKRHVIEVNNPQFNSIEFDGIKKPCALIILRPNGALYVSLGQRPRWLSKNPMSPEKAA